MRAVIAAAVTVILASLLLGQESTDATQAKILALENAWNIAEAHQDTKAQEHLLSYSLVYIEQDGTLMDRAQFLASVKKQAAEQLKVVTESMTAHVYGTTAIVAGIYRVTGISQGKPYSHRGRFIDTSIEDNGTWQSVSAQATAMRGN